MSVFTRPELVFPPDTNLFFREACPLAGVMASEMGPGEADRFRLLFEKVLEVC